MDVLLSGNLNYYSPYYRQCSLQTYTKDKFVTKRMPVAINPVNWRTDATPATLITEPSPLIPLDEQRKDTLTVTLDKPSGLLFVKGYSAIDYIIPLIGKEGCYHSREIWLYRDQLRDNIALRTARYLKQTTNL